MSTSDPNLAAFWRATGLGGPVPAAWAFGDNAALADELLALVLDGTKTATASALWDYEADDEPMPQPDDLSILLDGAGMPRAVIRTTDVITVPFDDVDAAHAHAEGEDDRTLASWRRGHETFFRRTAAARAEVDPRGFDGSMPIVLERFELVFPVSSDARRTTP